MLSFQLTTADRGSRWRTTPDGFARGSSVVRPFRHDALETVCVTADARLLVWVRERHSGRRGPEMQFGVRAGQLQEIGAAGFDALADALHGWPLQWQSLLVEDPGRKAEAPHTWQYAVLKTGSWGTAPVFFVAEGDRLWGDWDAERLLPRLRRSDLDLSRAARNIADYDTPYARRTMFRGLELLTERGCAVWAGAPGQEALAISYPEPWRPRPPAGSLKPEADPVQAFRAILSASLQRWVSGPGGQLGTEVSGGLDSGIVAAEASALCSAPLHSYGVALMGASAADQAARRQELVRRFGLTDTTVEIAAHLPLAAGSGRLDGRLPVLPWEEGYYEVFDELLARAAADGISMMLTGFGGDELCGLRPSEVRSAATDTALPPAGSGSRSAAPSFLTQAARATLDEDLDLPPRAASAESAVTCAAFSAARYLRHGIWPVHPLCTPQLVEFCARLPAAWRSRRRIERMVLTSQDCSNRVTRPQQQDDFSWALLAALHGSAQPVLRSLFNDSLLHDLGVIDAPTLIATYDAWLAHGSRDAAVPFLAVATTELSLRKMRS